MTNTSRNNTGASIIHPTAEVAATAVIGRGTRIWHHVQVREGARIGNNCIVGKGSYIDALVSIGDRVKVQNGCYVYSGSVLEDGVFLGPGVILTNDRVPRAINADGSLKQAGDWVVGRIRLKRGASLGAGVIVLPEVTVGEFAMAGCGAVISRDVPPHALVVGNPARIVAFVCSCGLRIQQAASEEDYVVSSCAACHSITRLSAELWQSLRERTDSRT